MDKIKAVLVNPDYMLYADPPLGIAYIAAYLMKNNPNVELIILDQLPPKKLIKKLRKINPDLIGMSAVSINYFRVKTLAEEIKKNTNSLLVIGGVHITTSPYSFKASPFDIALLGEAEKTLSTLLNHLSENNKKLEIKQLKKIPGFLLRDKNKIINTGLPELIQNLDDIPLPARNVLNMKYYMLPSILSGEDFEPVASLLTSRGCPYNCPFCSTTAFWKRRIRFFSAKRVVDEISILYNKYNYRKIYIYDDIFSLNKVRLKEIVRLMKQRNLLGKITFYVYGRTDIFDEELAKLLKKMNVKTIVFGFESGSQKMLNYLKEGRVTLEHNIKAIEICKKYNFEIEGFFMIGSPGETEEDIKQTYEFIKKYCPHAIVYQTIPFPGTQVWQYALKKKLLKQDYYDHKIRDWVDTDLNYLLTDKISKEKFQHWFNKIKEIYIPYKRSHSLAKFKKIKLKHISILLSPTFLKKAYNLRHQFLKRFIVQKQGAC